MTPAPTRRTSVVRGVLCAGPGIALLHVLYDALGEGRRRGKRGTGHAFMEVDGDKLLLDRLFHRLLDHVSCFLPTKQFEQKNAGENDRAGVDDILVREARRRSVRGFEDSEAVTEVHAGRDAEAADLRGCCVGEIVSVEVRRRKDGILCRLQQKVLEGGVGDAIVDEDHALPLAVAVGLADLRKNVLHFGGYLLAKSGRSEGDAGLYDCGDLFGCDAWVLIECSQNPALTLRNNLGAELFLRNLVSPIEEGTFGELLDVALMHDRHHLAVVIDGVLNGCADKALGAVNRDRLDAEARVVAKALFGSGEHLRVHELHELLRFGGALFELDAGVDVFRVLAEENDVDFIGLEHGAGHAGIVLYRADALVEIERLAQGYVERTDATADGRGEGSLDRDAEVDGRLHGVLGKPVALLAEGLLACEDLVPLHLALALVGLLYGSVEDHLRVLPDIAAGAVAFDEGNDGVRGDDELSVFVIDDLSVGRKGDTVIARLHNFLARGGFIARSQ